MIAPLRGLLLILMLILSPVSGWLVLGPTTAEAQQPPSAPDYSRWETIGKRAVDTIDAQRASTSAFEIMREQLTEWRSVFDAARSVNTNAIAALEGQLRALGKAPAEGEPEEAPEITTQRKELNDQLAELRAPVKKAELAYSKADELIRSIDRIIRERSAEELLERGPSPLNPAHWRAAATSFATTFEAVRSEIDIGLNSKVQRAKLAARLPVTAVLAVIGLVLLVRGRFWTELAVRLVRPHSATSGRWIVGFLVSLGQVIVPYCGMLLLVHAFNFSGFHASTASAMLDVLKTTVLIFLIVRWTALRCFPRRGENRLPLLLEHEDRRKGRLYGGGLGLLMAVAHFVNTTSQFVHAPTEARVVALFPLMLGAAVLLTRISRLLALHTRSLVDDVGADDASEVATRTYRQRLVLLLSKVLIFVAVAGPVLIAIGYFKAGFGLMVPTMSSLLLLGILTILQRVIRELYSLAVRDRAGAADELLPMLLGFGLILASMPIFALIWGARVADLSELWVNFRRGITIGDLNISPSIFLTFAIVFAVGFIITRVIQGTLKNTLLPKTRINTGGRDAIVSGLGYIGIFSAMLIAIISAGIDLSSLAIVAGALSVGIGFGLQNIVSNFVSGIILLIERPISQGDWIEVNGQHGTVREIAVRSTRIETFDRSDLIIPNADLISGTVTNYTKGSTVGRVIIKVAVAYGSDTKRVESILRSIARAHPMVLMNPEPAIIFKGIGVGCFDFEIRAILRDINFIMSVTSDLNHDIVAQFAKEGIEMPFQQRDIWLRNPETLVGAMGAARARERADGETSRGTGVLQGAQQVGADGSTGAWDAER